MRYECYGAAEAAARFVIYKHLLEVRVMEIKDKIKEVTIQGRTHYFTLNCLFIASLLAVTLLLVACGGGGGSASGSGDVQIGLTDARGDFASYTVDVLSLTLTRQNGQVVETLPNKTRVDFSQYTDMTEFLTIATVPGGVYVKGTLTLDYSNADIQVEDDSGNALKVNNLVDGTGTTVSQLKVSVKLQGQSRLLIAPGIPAHLTLDFDLKQSNSVAFDNNNVPTVTVSPFLIAEVNAKTPKQHRVRGPLKAVDVATNSFGIYIHPFRQRLSNGVRHFGVLNVTADNKTVYEINGTGFTGSAGLAELALQTTLTAVIVKGDIQLNPRKFVAREVYAGSSVPGGTLDVVRGSVMARNGNTLTVRGGTLIRTDGTAMFSDNITVLLDASTVVSKQLSAAPFAITDISVGQRITVFGTVSADQQGHFTLDAANGHARMHVSIARGTVLGLSSTPGNPPSYPFVLNVATINGRNASLYDFTGTGIDAANDAKRDFYEIDTGNLDITLFAANSKVAVGGFVTSFGSAPADFTAVTIVSAPYF
ncbi:MAG TPA: DUF4382 domain-containing protein [Gammaproteobacteria bacterium]|nr:DUF4382 domain-containing protein [Gammaproteobacteria bacterium]